MYAVRILGVAWVQQVYGLAKPGEVTEDRDLSNATRFPTLEKALSFALIVTTRNPDLIGKLAVRKIREVRFKRVRCWNPQRGKNEQPEFAMVPTSKWVTT